MSARTDVSTLDRPVESSIAHSHERRLEAEVLLQAFAVLRRAQILTDAEFEAKRQRHLALL